MKNKGFGHLKTRLFTIKTSKNVGFGGPIYRHLSTKKVKRFIYISVSLVQPHPVFFAPQDSKIWKVLRTLEERSDLQLETCSLEFLENWRRIWEITKKNRSRARWFKVTFLSPSWRSLSLWRGHLTIAKRSQRIARWLFWCCTVDGLEIRRSPVEVGSFSMFFPLFTKSTFYHDVVIT